MSEKKQVFQTVSAYINQFEPSVQKRLHDIRQTILAALPDAHERISWGMPTYTLKRDVIHFGAAKHHIGIYPGPDALEHFQNELGEYGHSKGTLRIRHDQEIPFWLIQEIIGYRLEAMKASI